MAIWSKAQREGRPSPLDNRPAIPNHVAWVWRAYGRLSSTRDYSVAGPRGIRFTEIEAFASVTMLDRESTLELVEYVELLERAFFSISRELRDSSIES